MKSKSFYLDEKHSREIKIQWDDSVEEVDILDDGEVIHQHKNKDQLRKGIMLPASKGENLYIRLFSKPIRWQVQFGNQLLLHSYNHALESLKSVAQIFYYIFLATFMLLMVQELPRIKHEGISLEMLIEPRFLSSMGLVILFYLCSLFIRKGKTIWYFVGGSIYIIDTVLVFVYLFIESDFPLAALTHSSIGMIFFVLILIRFVFIYYIIGAFKHAVEVRKQIIRTTNISNDEILDLD